MLPIFVKENKLKEEIVGKVFSTNKSGDCVVTKYVGCDEVYVKFLNTGFERVTCMSALKSGSVKDKSRVSYVPTKKKDSNPDKCLCKEDVEGYFEVRGREVLWSSSLSGKRSGKPILNIHKIVSFKGVTYRYEDFKALVLGEVPQISSNSKSVPEGYYIWNAMQKRCKDRGYPISEVFSKYETWVEWARQQKGFKELDFFNNTFNLDSDLFSNGVKTYSEETCVFIPQHLNQIYKTSYKGNEMLGVDFRKGIYQARIRLFNNQVTLGNYKTKEEAVEAYRNKRAEYVQLLLNLHRHQLEDKTIEFLEDDIKNNIFI